MAKALANMLTSGLFSLAMMSCRGPNTLTNVVRSSTSTVSCFIARTVALLQMRKHFICPECNNARPWVGAGRANVPRLKHWKRKRRCRGMRKLFKYVKKHAATKQQTMSLGLKGTSTFDTAFRGWHVYSFYPLRRFQLNAQNKGVEPFLQLPTIHS